MRVCKGLMGRLAIAGLLALGVGAAHAQTWCGFHRKADARVHCGYSSLQECKHALADKNDAKKDVTCMPNPAQG